MRGRSKRRSLVLKAGWLGGVEVPSFNGVSTEQVTFWVEKSRFEILTLISMRVSDLENIFDRSKVFAVY
jgi:hypothetical protein